MKIMRVLYYPNPLLREVAKPLPVEDIPKSRPFFDELVRSMYAWDGVAIAAPQVGVSMRVIVVDLRPATEAGERMPQIPLVMINPELLDQDHAGELAMDSEGCLSFPGVHVQVLRAKRVKARFVGVDAQVVEQEFTGLQARAVAHEIDHLDGRLLIDHITSAMRRDMVERKMAKVAKHGGPRPRAPRAE